MIILRYINKYQAGYVLIVSELPMITSEEITKHLTGSFYGNLPSVSSKIMVQRNNIDPRTLSGYRGGHVKLLKQPSLTLANGTMCQFQIIIWCTKYQERLVSVHRVSKDY